MKLFEEVGSENFIDVFRRSDGSEYEVPYTIYELKLVEETVNYLLNESGGSTLSRIRALIVNLYNCTYYPAPDLFGLMRNADDSHAELVVNIIDGCSLKYRDSCFLMIDDLAPKIIDRFHPEEDDEETA